MSTQHALSEYMQHLPDCWIVEGYAEAIHTFDSTPLPYRDDRYYEKLSALKKRAKDCDCGLSEAKKKVGAVPEMLEALGSVLDFIDRCGHIQEEDGVYFISVLNVKDNPIEKATNVLKKAKGQ